MFSYAVGHLHAYFSYQFGKKDNATPLFDWGKFYEKNGKIVIPISVQAHHSFVDGIHIGKFVDKLQRFSIDVRFQFDKVSEWKKIYSFFHMMHLGRY